MSVMTAGPVEPVHNWREIFAFAKQVTNLDDVATKSLAVQGTGNGTIGYLRPISADLVHDSELVLRLATWRIRHEYAYPSRGGITPESTSQWLTSAVVENPQRLLFLVTDQQLRPLGHLGLVISEDDGLEIDNVLRGEDAVPGIMGAAMVALESWAVAELDAERLTLRVLASNPHAVDFYERLGYSIAHREALQWSEMGATRRLIPSVGPVDDEFLHMVKNVVASQPASDHILTAGPLIGMREATYALRATRTGWNDQHSNFLNLFERDFATYVGAKHAMATSSCTGALHLALLAMGIGPGDEVIVPETTWVASGAAVRYVGATPVFADVDAATWTITPDTIAPCLSERTRAIIPVHLYGYPADMTAIMALARSHGLLVLEDAAPAIGALVDSQPVGSFGDMAAFSFQGAKMLVTGEGGMLVTNSVELRARAWKQQDHGRVPGTFWIDELGRKYKMSNLTAALGEAQLENAETQIAKKRRINAWYREFLADTPGISFQEEGPSTRSICWMSSVVIEPELVSRDTLVSALREEGIDSRPVFPPISAYPIWGTERGEPSPVALRIGAHGINLPSGVRLSRASVERVALIIDRVVRNER